jgi:hypothetical protein
MQSAPQPERPQEDFIDVIFNLRPMDFREIGDDGQVISFEGVRRHLAAPGSPVFALRVHAPSPDTPADREELEQLLRELKVDFTLVAPVEEDLKDLPDEPVLEGLDPGSRLSFEAELRDVNRNCLSAAGADLLVVADPKIGNGEVDTWKSIQGIVRSGKIKVTAGRAELRSSSSSSTKNAVDYTASLKAKTLKVIGRRRSSGYTFVGKFALS